MATFSPLFRHAHRAAQNVARQQFRRTQFGQLLSEFERLTSRRPSGIRDLAAARAAIGKFSRAGLMQQLRKQGIGNVAGMVEKYAAGQGNFRKDALGSLFQAMGPLGGLLKKLFSSAERIRRPLERELDAAIGLLHAFGFEVLPPEGRRRGARGQRGVAAATKFLRDMGYFVSRDAPATAAERRLQEQFPGTSFTTKSGKPRTSITIPLAPGRRPKRVSVDDPMVTGEMIPVAGSSNVHSFGYDYGTGTLRIRFLGRDRSSGKRGGPGPMYEYSGVPPTLFERMRKAASKGRFIWDHIRIRGTVSGHRFDYRLADITGGYVPRKATLTANEEWYLQREFRRGGKSFRSSLPDQMVRRGTPNRGTPNRGTPNRGRP